MNSAMNDAQIRNGEVRIAPVTLENRERVNEFILSRWFSLDMIIRGEVVDMRLADGFIAYKDETILGLITYRYISRDCEILSLDSLKENQGIGTALIGKVKETAVAAKCERLKLITTNDNIHAIRFYQKRGFDLACLYHDAVDAARRLKPSIPLLGDDDIPIRHELEFVYDLEPATA